MKALASILFLSLSVNCLGQDISLAGENFLLMDQKKIAFSKIEGYWFSHTKDAHVTLFMYAKDGAQLQLETDGKAPSITLKRDENLQFAGRQHFYMIMADGSGGPPENDVAGVRVSFLKFDNQNLHLDLSGTTNGPNGAVPVSGKIRLTKKSSPQKITNQTLAGTPCDNTIYNKLFGASNRSPTECEIAFDKKVKTTIQEAFAGAIGNFKSSGWLVAEETEIKPLEGINEGSEDYFSRTGDYEIKLQMDPSSASYAPLLKKFEEATENVRNISDYNSDDAKKKMEHLMVVTYEVQNATTISIRASINHEGYDVGTFKAEHHVLPVKGIAYTIQASHASSLTGGGAENARDVTCAYIGKWSVPSVEKHDDGGDNTSLKTLFDQNASHLTVQSMIIRIECNASIAGEILKKLDIAKLNSLVQK